MALQMWYDVIKIHVTVLCRNRRSSVTFFDRIAVFKTPYCRTSIKGGTRTWFVDAWISNTFMPLMEVQQYGSLSAAMWSKYESSSFTRTATHDRIMFDFYKRLAHIYNHILRSFEVLAQLPVTRSTVAGEGLVYFLTWVTSQIGQIMQTWATCKPQKTLPACTHWSTTILSQKMAAHKGALMSLFTRQPGGQRVYQTKTVKTHSNNSVVLVRIQLSLSTVFLPMTSLTWGYVPGPLPILYCKWQKAGRGPRNEAKLHLCDTLSTQPRNAICRFSWKCIEVFLS